MLPERRDHLEAKGSKYIIRPKTNAVRRQLSVGTDSAYYAIKWGPMSCPSGQCREIRMTLGDDFHTPNQTSAAFLLKVIETGPRPEEAEARRRFDLAFDVYIKARSYAVLNKVCFFLALAGTIAVVCWPVIAVLEVVEGTVLSESVTQTAVTAFTCFAVYFYSFYKKRQMAAETLMRTIAFSDRPVSELWPMVLDELARIDEGFAFKGAEGRNEQTGG
jgi:hypothetical protein